MKKFQFHLLAFAFLFFCESCKKEMIPVVTPQSKDIKFELVWKEKLLKKDEFVLVRHSHFTDNGGIVYEKAFVGPDSVITCRNKMTGKVMWAWSDLKDIIDGEFVTSILPYKDKVGIGSWHEMSVLDTKNGQSFWKTDVQDIGFSGYPRAGILDGYIYHSIADNIPTDIFTTLRRTPIGSNQWEDLFTIKVAEENGFSPNFESFALWKNPQTGHDILLFQNRQVRFQIPSAKKVDFYAYNLNTRKVEWRIDSIDQIANSSVSAPILVHGNKAFFMGAITLSCVDLLQKKVIWEKHYNERTPTIYSENLLSTYPVIADNKLIIKPREERMFAYDVETGTELWRTEDGCKGQSATLVYKDMIFIPSIGQGDVWVHRLSDGKLVTRLTSPNKNTTNYSDAYITNKILIDETTGYLYCTDGYFMMCYKIKIE